MNSIPGCNHNQDRPPGDPCTPLQQDSAAQVSPPGSQRLHTHTGSYRDILYLTAPLVLSSTGLMLMHLIDAIFLSWYSEEAIAVVGPASMGAFVMIALPIGIASYTSTFVAQYAGAGRPGRIGAAVWQGLYFGLCAGLVIALCGALVARPLFAWVDHVPELQKLEVKYFTIVCLGAPFSLLGAALSGFFSGRGDNKTLMVVQLAGFLVNGVLSYAAIFGHFGLPKLGAAGAAAATAAAQALVAMTLLAAFFLPQHRERFETWSNRALDVGLLKRMLYFGSFNGLRFVAELIAWTLFLFYVGRLGQTEIAITNIVWRINGLAFFPLIGLSTAVATLVGHAQGSSQSHKAVVVTWRGLAIGQAWMLLAALLFVLLPRQFLGLFSGAADMTPDHFQEMAATGVILLRFVAAYCVLDGLNIVFLGALQGAGDTRWTVYVSFILHLIFLGALALVDQNKDLLAQRWSKQMVLYIFWGAATAFVMLQAFVWMARFKSGRWKEMRVIEAAEPGVAPPM